MFKTIYPNHELSEGNYTSEEVQLAGSAFMASAIFEDIIVNDIIAYIEQSADNENWGIVPDSSITIKSAQTSAHWNVIGLVRGAYVRLQLFAGSAVSGKLTGFKVLSDD